MKSTFRSARASLLIVCQTFAWSLPAFATMTLTKWPQSPLAVTAATFTGYLPWNGFAADLEKSRSINTETRHENAQTFTDIHNATGENPFRAPEHSRSRTDS